MGVSFNSENTSQREQKMIARVKDKIAPIPNLIGSKELFNNIQKINAIKKETRMFFSFMSNNLHLYISKIIYVANISLF